MGISARMAVQMRQLGLALSPTSDYDNRRIKAIAKMMRQHQSSLNAYDVELLRLAEKEEKDENKKE